MRIVVHIFKVFFIQFVKFQFFLRVVHSFAYGFTQAGMFSTIQVIIGIISKVSAAASSLILSRTRPFSCSWESEIIIDKSIYQLILPSLITDTVCISGR